MMTLSSRFLTTTLLSALLLPAGSGLAQTSSNEPVRGPFYSGTIRAPKANDAIAMKGIVVAVGAEKVAHVCYDTDLMRVSMAWTGSFLDFGDTLTKIAWPPPPQVKGNPVFATKVGPGWAKGESINDPRTGKQGPLPKEWAHYKGLYQHGDSVVFEYTVGETRVLELPGYEGSGVNGAFTRTFNIAPSKTPLTVVLCGFDASSDLGGDAKPGPVSDRGHIVVGKEKRLAVGIVGDAVGAKFGKGADELRLELPALPKGAQIKVLLQPIADDNALTGFEAALKKSDRPKDLAGLCKGGPARWTEKVQTKGVRGGDSEAYVVDTLTEPSTNPYNAKNFFGGFDFLSDGRAAICTFHGDVWVVSGIDDSLGNLTWKRFATGLFQPLGLKVVDDKVYVMGRDQITRLHDLNNDGEADRYENFNNDTIVTANYHEFTLDLHTDPEGNFYFAKGAPWEPQVTSPHQGCLFKLSKDGTKLEVIGTGLRAPNGMTVGPRGEITVGDNQGHWMPSSKLNWVEKGGFYGMVPAAQREMKLTRSGTNFTANPSDPKHRTDFAFKGWGDDKAPQPEGYDEPICWLPMNADNSSGGQVWVTSTKWGPLNDRLLFMSYGKCTLFEVMLDEVEGTRQAAMVQMPLKFNSGIMRARFNPKDGQLYLCGLRGWQTSATRDGGLYRVRYTGKPVQMPSAFRASQKGVKITFTSAVEAKSAADSANYSCERWDYKWTGAYGSPEFSVTNPNAKGHDKLEVKSVRVLPDGKSVFLEIPEMKPADQLKVKYTLDTAAGGTISQEIYATVHKLAAAE